MARKVKLVNKFENYTTHEGTYTKGESMTDQSQRQEADIYACLEKYGAQALLNKTRAQEFLYLDNTNANMTLDEAVRIQKDMKDYFEQLPAKVRKTFGDKAEIFIEKYKRGEFNDFIATGVLSDEMVAELTPSQPVNPSVPDVTIPTQPEQNIEIQGGVNNEQIN